MTFPFLILKFYFGSASVPPALFHQKVVRATFVRTTPAVYSVQSLLTRNKDSRVKQRYSRRVVDAGAPGIAFKTGNRHTVSRKIALIGLFQESRILFSDRQNLILFI